MINPRQTHHRDTYIPAVREFLHKLFCGDDGSGCGNGADAPLEANSGRGVCW
jgi:hypothetical protein